MDNVSLLKNLYAAFGRGDVPTVLGAMSADIEWHQAEGNPYMPSGEAWVGPDSVLNNLFMRLGEEWVDTQVCHVWDVKDGKLTRFQQYLDTAKVQDVMAVR